MDPVIRPATADDWEALHEIRLRALREDPRAYGSTFEHESTRTPAEWRARLVPGRGRATFLAEVGDRVVGIARAEPWEGPSDDLGLFGMWVAPEARRRGLGERLVERVVALGRADGFGSVRLEVAGSQPDARRLYERCGFRDTGERRTIRETEQRPTGVVMSRPTC